MTKSRRLRGLGSGKGWRWEERKGWEREVSRHVSRGGDEVDEGIKEADEFSEATG